MMQHQGMSDSGPSDRDNYGGGGDVTSSRPVRSLDDARDVQSMEVLVKKIEKIITI